jgi:hypothetical protein
MIALNMSRFNTLAEISHVTPMNGLSVTFFFCALFELCMAQEMFHS